MNYTIQKCSEMVIPVGTGNDTMFPPHAFDLKSYVEDCKKYLVSHLALIGLLLTMETMFVLFSTLKLTSS